MRRSWGWTATGVVVLVGLVGCTSPGAGKNQGGATVAPVAASGSGSGSGSASGSASPSISPPSTVTFEPASGVTGVRMDQTIIVRADQGSLTSVKVTAKGKELDGELDQAGQEWHSTGRLAAATDYTVTAVASTSEGAPVTQTSTFSTLRPTSTVGLVLNVGDGQVVGVGMPIVLQFSRSVKNKAAVEKALSVTSTPSVEGAWHWMSDQSVWYRPKQYWPAGTKVHLAAAIGTAELAPGLWGRRTYTSDFSIGASVISTVDVSKHTITVTRNGAVVRVLPVTTGKSTPKGNFLTRGGIKVIMEKAETTRMNAATLGTTKDDPEFYDEVEHWTMRLTWSGEYLHARPGSEYAFGRSNISHGCTGLSNANAKWLFDFSHIGDVVVYKNSPRQLEWGNGYTAWQMDYAKWSAAGGT